MTKFQRRLELALSLSGMKAKEIAAKAGMSEANISQYRKGLSMPRGTDRMLALANALNVSPGWLMGYDGPMQPTDQEIIAAFSSLSPEKKMMALDYIRYLQTKGDEDV